MSREEFFPWAEAQHGRYEFDGFEPVAMTGGTLGHSLICQNLWAALRVRLQGSAYTSLGPDAGLGTAGGAVRYPDAMIVGGAIDRLARVASDVVVVFEVISPASGQTDRIVKVREYLGVASISRYVIIEHEFIGVTMFTRDTSGTAWQATALAAEDTLQLPEPGIGMTVAELYQNVNLPQS